MVTLSFCRDLEDADVTISEGQLSQYVRSYSDPKTNDPRGGTRAAVGTNSADGNGTSNEPLYRNGFGCVNIVVTLLHIFLLIWREWWYLNKGYFYV